MLMEPAAKTSGRPPVGNVTPDVPLIDVGIMIIF